MQLSLIVSIHTRREGRELLRLEFLVSVPPSPRVFNLYGVGRLRVVAHRVHGHQIFVDGAFNGDPHPGNILLTPDGKLGLIDYGQARALVC